MHYGTRPIPAPRRPATHAGALSLGLAGLLVVSGAASGAVGANTAGNPTQPPAAAARAAPADAGIQVRDAWIRWLPAQLPAGGYLTLVNTTGSAITLTGASSPDYGTVSLHRSLDTGGTSRMVAVAGIRVAAHASLDFAGSGYHLMLVQPRTPLQPGAHVPVTLQFADHAPVTVQFALRPPDTTGNASGAAQQGGTQMKGMDMKGMNMKETSTQAQAAAHQH